MFLNASIYCIAAFNHRKLLLPPIVFYHHAPFFSIKIFSMKYP